MQEKNFLPGTSYKLEGYCEETKPAYEYHGCMFHGYPVLGTRRIPSIHQASLDKLYTLTMKKKAYLENLGMKYICIWDYEIHKLKIKTSNEELKMDYRDRPFIFLQIRNKIWDFTLGKKNPYLVPSCPTQTHQYIKLHLSYSTSGSFFK